MRGDLRLLLGIMIAMLALTSASSGQGFAGLGEQIDGFEDVNPDTVLKFPEDHGAHEGFRIEWWYVTANFTDVETGEPFGAQWTLFRTALQPNDGAAPSTDWSSPQVYMAHAALTSGDKHVFAERFARGGGGHAGVTATPFEAYIDDWRFASVSEDGSLSTVRLQARDDDFRMDFELTADRPVILHGENGYSVKAESGEASHYYSQPFFNLTGAIVIDGEERSVVGAAWMDREWSSRLLRESQSGWDWFSLHFANGEKAMLFQLRDDVGDPFYAGTWISKNGDAAPIRKNAIRLDPVRTVRIRKKRVPVEWRIRIDDRNVDIRTRPVNAHSWMATSFPYWEGPISFEGTNTGVGYLEMTGYDQ